MRTKPYCTINKNEYYRTLLSFARISRRIERELNSEKQEADILEALNSLSDSNSIIHSIRPFLPLIYHNTALAGMRNQLQPEPQALLKNNTISLYCTELMNQHWLNKTLMMFKEGKTPVILLKGAAFSRNIYPENTPRVGVDLDLLVTDDDFEPTCALLNKTMDPVLQNGERIATHDTLFERVFVPKKGTGSTVEIHRGLTNPSIFNIDEQSLWTASRKHPAYNSERVRILSPEDTLLHLAVHAFRDLDFCTHNILDAHEVWCQWKPDLERLSEKATQWGARKVLFYLLANCKIIMDTPVPDSLLNDLKPTYLVDSINKNVLQSPTLNNVDHTSLCHRMIQLISQITFPDHITHGLKYQLTYTYTRLNDWITSHRSQ